jgi:hypothetical protein
VIHGCYSKSGGTLRVIDRSVTNCKATVEPALDWNRQGPAGPAGPKGDAGAPGVSTATFAFGDIETNLTDAPQKVASKSVPAGSWVAVATTTIESPFPFAGDRITWSPSGITRRSRVAPITSLLQVGGFS